MKSTYRNIAIAICFIALYSCEDNFLEKIPKDQITIEGYFNQDSDFRAYAYGLYNTFFGYGVGNVGNTNIPVTTDEMVGGNQDRSSRIFDTRIIPSSGGGWSWSRLRTINIMIREAQNTDLAPEIKNHWEGVGRLFRALEYFNKVKSFGDVPWIDHELGTESPELYMAQDPRSLVMENVLADLNFAVENIRENDGANLIDRYTALAIKSEITLFEGTFRKYHTELGLTDFNSWLEESVLASEKIMESGLFSLNPDYRTIHSSLDLSGNPEIILYKQYEIGVLVNTQVRTTALSNARSLTKDAVESYLSSDGLPFGISPLHSKAQNGIPESVFEEFENRDPRMGMTLAIPFNEGEPSPNDPALIEANTQIKPDFLPSLLGEAGINSATGYGLYKWWNPESPYDDVNGITDAPLYSFNKILLNYAEAKAELGQANDEVLNRSINLLRGRVGMHNLTIAIANSFDDPKKQKYAPEISNILWEIRRERRVELMGEGSRFDDILRWKKASYFGKPFVGAYIDLDNRPPSAYNPDGSNKAAVTLGDRDGNILPSTSRQGYILPYLERQPSWSDDDLKLYYSPISVQDLTINPNLQQVPGW